MRELRLSSDEDEPQKKGPGYSAAKKLVLSSDEDSGDEVKAAATINRTSMQHKVCGRAVALLHLMLMPASPGPILCQNITVKCNS